jgi:hypothetical protein
MKCSKCCKVLTVKDVYLAQVCLNGRKGSMNGGSRYKTMNVRPPALQLLGEHVGMSLSSICEKTTTLIFLDFELVRVQQVVAFVA